VPRGLNVNKCVTGPNCTAWTRVARVEPFRKWEVLHDHPAYAEHSRVRSLSSLSHLGEGAGATEIATKGRLSIQIERTGAEGLFLNPTWACLPLGSQVPALAY
jgi:hypothetical protein